ncbi:hypothetical protein [Fischerella sp. PCC 9605]|nr:hypothetical protein [Fischerella sp. PCC 9605]
MPEATLTKPADPGFVCVATPYRVTYWRLSSNNLPQKSDRTF